MSEFWRNMTKSEAARLAKNYPIPVVNFNQECRICHKTGDSRDEFLSPYNGKCANCQRRDLA